MTVPAKTSRFNHSPAWKRWLWRILFFTAVSVALVLIAGQIIFTTNLPRNLVVSAVEQSLGFRVKADSLSTSWAGHSSLRGVSLSLPLSDNAFVEFPNLEITHSNIAWILLGGSISIDEITADHPTLHIVQGPGGSWNLSEIIRIVARDVESSKPSSEIPAMPALNISDVSVVVTDNKNRSATIQHLDINAYSDGPVVWNCRLAVAGQLDIAAKLAPGGDWAYEIAIGVHDIRGYAQPWDTDFPASVQVDAHWRGRIDNDELTGRLNIVGANYGSRGVKGTVDVATENGQFVVRPVDLSVGNSDVSTPLARFESGVIAIGGGAVQVQNLLVDFAGGRGAINGQCELGNPRINLDFNGRGAVAAGTWNSHLVLTGGGDDFHSLSGSLTAPTLRFDPTSAKSIDLSGFAADLRPYPGGVEVTNLHVGDAFPFMGHGGYDFRSACAWIDLNARAWPIPNDPTRKLDFNLDVWSSPDRLHLERLYAQSGLFTACLAGDWVFDAPKPIEANVWFTEVPRTVAGEAEQKIFRGGLLGDIVIAGNPHPADLGLTGWALGSNLRVGQRDLGNLRITLAGRLHNGEVSLGSRDIRALGGMWTVSGVWPVDDALFRLDSITVQNLPIARIADDARLGGKLNGKWSIDVHGLSRDAIDVRGSTTITGLAFDDPNSPATQMLDIDQIQIPDVRLQDGYLNLPAVTLLRKTSAAEGKATLGVSTTLDAPGQISVTFNTSSWPVQPPNVPVAALVSSSGNVNLDIPGKSVFGSVDVKTENTWHDKPLSEVTTHLEITGRSVRADPIEITRQGGTANGSAQFDLDHPYETAARLDWKDLDIADVSRFFADSNALQGKSTGSLRVGPDTSPRAIAPLAVKVILHNNGVKYENLGIGDGQISAHIGPDQLVLDDTPQSPTRVMIAGGKVDVWARITRHGSGIYQTLVNVYLNDLDLNALLPEGTKVGKTPGLLGGEITAIGEPGNPRNAFGQGQLTLTHSDLAGTGPISILYDLMHFSHNANRPMGEGRIDFTIENQAVYIMPMQYFDRGRQVRLSGVISDLPNLPHCPLDLIAAGSIRPFSSINILGVQDVDKLLSALQHDVVSVHVTGYLDSPHTKPVALGAISREARNLLLGIFSPGGR
jgi:hypothetical protein